jgi:hypothetical protein
MSGGYIKPQKSGDHQVVIFTFAGELKKNDVDRWNEAILELKRMFGPSVLGVTLKGDRTPAKLKGR